MVLMEKRMKDICEHVRINHEIIEFAENENPSAVAVAEKIR